MRLDRIPKMTGYTVFGVLFFVLYLLQYTGCLPHIGTAVAAPLVPAVVLVALQYKEWVGGIFGLIAGSLMDIMGAGSACFHAFTLFLLGCVAGLLIKYYLNNNLWSALALIVGFCVLFFFVKWLVFYTGVTASGRLLLQWGLGSAVYTAAFGVLLYFLLRLLFRRLEVKRI